MKKAGIITHYNVHNHGAHLQMYALIKSLEKKGYEAKALRFKKNYDFIGNLSAENKYNISVKSIPVYVRYLIRNGLGKTLYNYKKRKILRRFREDNKLVGEYYSEAKDLDVVVIGSDEIFSIEAGPNPWYYGIGISCNNQISYAASFGPTTIEMIKTHNVEPLISAGLNNINQISVRDRNSFELVKYFTGQEAKIVCDPVLLYEFPDQKKQIKLSAPPSKEEYCIVYSYDSNMNDSKTVEAIKRYAKQNRLKIYSIAYYHKWCDKNIQVSPLEIFKWFANATMVFTDTFHGTVISLSTEAQFVAKIRGNGNKLEFLLEQFEVQNRKVDEFEELEKIVANLVDYNKVNKLLENYRNESELFIDNSLEAK